MTKIAAAALLVAAFGYALWLHILRQSLPNVTVRHGWRRRFLWATVLFAAWMGTQIAHSGENPRVPILQHVPVCFGLVAKTPTKAGLSETVRAVWLSLDGNRGEELRLVLEKEVKAKGLSANAAKLLQVAFRETTYHYYRTRGEGVAVWCYESGIGLIGETSEFLLTRMEFLVEAGRKGQIDTETYGKVAAEIAQSLAALGAADTVNLEDGRRTTPEVREKRAQVAKAIEKKTVPVTPAATEGAALLANMAANAPEGWGEAEYDADTMKKKERKPGAWQPPPPLSHKHGGFD